MTLKQKVALYEELLNRQAEWDVPDDNLSCTDYPGAVAEAREVLRKAGVAPKKG